MDVHVYNHKYMIHVLAKEGLRNLHDIKQGMT